MRLTLKSFGPAIACFISSNIAFFLPGSSLPDEDWFGKIQLDKIVHITLFTILIVLWSIPVFHRSTLSLRFPRLLVLIPFVFFAYSIVVEFVQHFFIPGRSFDLLDILADALGCIIGFLLMKQYQRFSSHPK